MTTNKIQVKTVAPELTKVVNQALVRPLRKTDPIRLALADVLEYQPN